MDKKLKNKQKEIMGYLKRYKKLPTSKIAFLISANFYQTEEYLNDLESKKLIEKVSEGYASRWRIK